MRFSIDFWNSLVNLRNSKGARILFVSATRCREKKKVLQTDFDPLSIPGIDVAQIWGRFCVISGKFLKDFRQVFGNEKRTTFMIMKRKNMTFQPLHEPGDRIIRVPERFIMAFKSSHFFRSLSPRFGLRFVAK